MTGQMDQRAMAMDVLKKYGGKWAVLLSMSVDMARKGISVARDVNEKLRNTRLKIGSGCFSPCEVSCALAEVESELFSHCHLLEDADFMKWSDLLAEAMQGKLDDNRILAIPALEPVRNDCGFLSCGCSDSARL